jgi:hypothetical protein
MKCETGDRRSKIVSRGTAANVRYPDISGTFSKGGRGKWSFRFEDAAKPSGVDFMNPFRP